MKFTTWRTWLWNKLGRFLRPKRPRTLATAGCVALGLATSWGGEAEAEVKFKIEVTPEHELLDAFVLYGTNATGPVIRSLGALDAGKSYTFSRSLNHLDLRLSGHREDEVTGYFHGINYFPAGYAIGGIYQQDDCFGMTVSFPNRLPVINQVSFEEFATWSQFSDIPWTEITAGDEQANVSQYLDTIGTEHLTLGIYHTYWNFQQDFNAVLWNQDVHREEQYLTPYGQQTTLISFRDTRFAGTAIVTIVPEPQSVFYVVAFAGMAMAAGGNKLSQGRAS